MTGVKGYTSYAFQDFGRGLNLRDKADAVSQAACIDAMNMLFGERGAAVQRSGYGELNAVALTNRVDSLSPYYTSAGTKQLLAGCGTRLEALSAAGEVLKSVIGLAGGPYGFARFGKPNAEVAYAGNGTDTLRRWNGTEWTAPTATVNGLAEKAMPKAGQIAAWPKGDNRLAATGFATTSGGPGGATSSPDHVYFSNSGDPTAWTNKEGEENYVQLFPGNGEKIQAIIGWREYLFVFKETAFFVFYGVSSNAEGAPEFLFRPVEAGVGLASPRAVCADENGVYFMSRRGVYRTTGQEPEEVSTPIEPIWSGDTSPFYTGGTLAHGSITNCAMAAHEGRIYLSFPTSAANNRTLVHDPQAGWWALTDIPAAALASFRPSSAEELVFAYAAGENKIGRHTESFTNDAAAAIASRWRSGWFDLDNPDVKTIRSAKLWGSGKCFVAIGHDFGQAVGQLKALDFSDSSADEWGKTKWGAGEWAKEQGLLPAHRRRAERGTAFSLYLENSIKDQPFSLHRADYHLREIRKPSTTKA